MFNFRKTIFVVVLNQSTNCRWTEFSCTQNIGGTTKHNKAISHSGCERPLPRNCGKRLITNLDCFPDSTVTGHMVLTFKYIGKNSTKLYKRINQRDFLIRHVNKQSLTNWIAEAAWVGSWKDLQVKVYIATRKLLNQGFLLARLKSSLRQFYGRHHDLVNRYEISVSQMTTGIFR